MTEPEPIRVSFRYSDLPMHRLHARVMQGFREPPRLKSRVLRALSWAALFIVFVIVFKALSAFQSGEAEDDLGPVIFGGGIGALVAIAIVSRFGKQIQARVLAALVDAPSRQGETEVRMDASGIEAHGTGTTWRIDWSCIGEVDEVEGFTLLKPSRAEFLPIPHDRLPPGVTPADLDRAIRLWRGTAPF